MKYGEWLNGKRVKWIEEEEYKKRIKILNQSIITNN
jgi:hypothetical protein